MDVDSDDEWLSTSDGTQPGHIEEYHTNSSVGLDDDIRNQILDEDPENFIATNSEYSLSSKSHDARTLGSTKRLAGAEEGSDAEWLSTSDDSGLHTHENYPDENRPKSTPASTEDWTITPKAWFLRDSTQNECSTDMCSQCSQIDFKAIFRLNAEMIGSSGNRTCSFSGLSRSMLISKCPACRVFATTVYTKYQQSDENALNLGKDTLEGHLVALSSGELCGYGIQPDFLTNQSVIIKIELLMAPLPFEARPWDSLNYLRPSGRQQPFWEYVRARGVILPAALNESAHIDFKKLKQIKGFCYGIPLEESINCHRISTMLHRCQQLHPSCRTNNGIEFPQDARAVDCKTRKVVPMVNKLPYIALSYVWGARSDADSSKASDSSERSDCLPQVLPRMIEDALNITIRLGYRYLWIDIFCINQYHSTDKAFQIQQMANIYSHASATICALAAHPDLGLPGISRSRPISESFQSEDITYIRVPEPNSLRFILKDSAWISRGWTFQEAILSQRCLFFTDEQVSLVCHTSHQTETISQLALDWIWGSNVNIFTAILGDGFSEPDLSFESFVNHYQGRHLSYESDALDAFKGLLSLAPTQSYFGILLPRSFSKHTNCSVAFAYGLLWHIDDSEEHPQEFRTNFPSWSWVSRKRSRITSQFTGERYRDEELQYKRLSQRALCMWMECSKRTWAAIIYTQLLNGDQLLIEDLFCRYTHMRVIPAESQVLRLQSFTITYQISTTHLFPVNGDPGYADVEIETSENLPFKLPNPDDAQRDHWYDFDKSYVKYLFDDISSINEPRKDSRVAILLLDNKADGFNPVSYWLALKPAYEENGRLFFFREGIIKICGRLKWKRGWESTPRDEVWLI